MIAARVKVGIRIMVTIRVRIGVTSGVALTCLGSGFGLV